MCHLYRVISRLIALFSYRRFISRVAQDPPIVTHAIIMAFYPPPSAKCLHYVEMIRARSLSRNDFRENPTVALSDIDATTGAVTFATPSHKSHVSPRTETSMGEREATRSDVATIKARDYPGKINRRAPTRCVPSSMRSSHRRDANHRHFVTYTLWSGREVCRVTRGYDSRISRDAFYLRSSGAHLHSASPSRLPAAATAADATAAVAAAVGSGRSTATGPSVVIGPRDDS